MDHQKNPAGSLLKQLAKFNLVGVVNTAVTYALYAGLVLAGMSHLWALVLDYAAGIALGFWLNRTFTFHSREPWLPALGRMTATYIPLLALNEVLLFALVDGMQMNKLVAQAGALGAIGLLSFVVQKLFVFRGVRSTMPRVISLPTFSDPRGSLTVIENALPFDVRRVYYIYSCAAEPRGGHRHHVTVQALVCVAGRCVIDWDNGSERGSTVLDRPDTLLVLEPRDWHVMRDFSSDAVLLVLASHPFDPADYIDEGYHRD